MTMRRDQTGSRIGMWIFLFTEILLFGGLFMLYSVYLHQFRDDFHYGASNLDTMMGTANTAVLLTSSLTMVLAVAAAGMGKRKHTLLFLMSTIGLGALFLVNKYFEWSAKIEHGLYPNSKVLLGHTPGEHIFYSLYYLMTGLHALHIVIGLVILAVMVVFALGDKNRELLAGRMENSGLYWHLVDVVWIFLFPLFYLIT